MLKIEELEVRDTLVHIETGVEYEIQMFLSDNEILLVGGEIVNDLAYFKKKEQSQCAFDDLIRTARKAFDDGIINHVKTSKSVVFELEITTSEGSERRWHHGDLSYIDGINYIKSLYKETFVIESKEDIGRIKKGAEITLSNGNKSKVSVVFSDKNAIKVDGWDYLLQFFVLKGATVEQSRNDQVLHHQ